MTLSEIKNPYIGVAFAKSLVVLPDVDRIIQVVCQAYKLEREDLQHETGKYVRYSMPRMMCWALIKDYYGNTYSLREIGRWFGGYDHSSILNGINKIKGYVEVDPEVTEAYYNIKMKLRGMQELDLSN